MSLSRGLVWVLLAILTVGCVSVPQASIPLNKSAVTQQGEKVGIAMMSVPKVDTFLPGAGCLLCLAVASAANSSLTKYANSLPYEGVDKLTDTIAQKLKSQGVEVVMIPETINVGKLAAFNRGKAVDVAPKNFQPLRNKYHVDRLMIIDIQGIGFMRTYSSYVPTSDPKAYLNGAGYIVNLSSNVYEWYLPVNILKSTEGAWDEPPQFPGLTNAYFQTLEVAKDNFLKPFAN